MPRRLVIQYAYGDKYFEQIAMTISRTIFLCGEYGYDYRLHTNKPHKHPCWERVRLLREALIAGYDQIFFLDTDSCWNLNTPLHAAIETDAVFHLTYHEACQQQPHNHFNAGVMYVNNTTNALRLVQEWEHTTDDGHQWAEQHALNKILFTNGVVQQREYPMLTQISHRWNAVPHIRSYDHPDPVVISWHGHPTTNQAMREYFDRNRRLPH